MTGPSRRNGDATTKRRVSDGLLLVPTDGWVVRLSMVVSFKHTTAGCLLLLGKRGEKLIFVDLIVLADASQTHPF